MLCLLKERNTLSILIVLLVGMCFVSSCDNSDSSTSHLNSTQIFVGTWICTNPILPGMEWPLSFQENGRYLSGSLEFGDSGNYIANFSFDPAHLDLHSDSGTVLLAIIEFIDHDSFHYQEGEENRDRPTHFTNPTTCKRQ